MSKVTGKFQITLPKKLADAYDIKVGDDLQLVAAGETIAIVPASAARTFLNTDERLRHFDLATRRQRARQATRSGSSAKNRGWTREELYTRGGAR